MAVHYPLTIVLPLTLLSGLLVINLSLVPQEKTMEVHSYFIVFIFDVHEINVLVHSLMYTNALP